MAIALIGQSVIMIAYMGHQKTQLKKEKTQ